MCRPRTYSETDFSMQRWTSYALRAGFIVGFLIVLPVMAMPQVAALLDQLLYGESKSTLPAEASTRDISAPRPTRSDSGPTTHEVPLPAGSASLLEELGPSDTANHFQAPPPPALRSSPDFVRQASNAEAPSSGVEAAAEVGPLDRATAERIDLVRSRLEELGAEYVRLEMSADGREYHCLCHMLVGEDPSQIQPFEATEKDPVSAAQAVLSSVEAWRTAERAPDRGSKSGPGGKPR